MKVFNINNHGGRELTTNSNKMEHVLTPGEKQNVSFHQGGAKIGFSAFLLEVEEMKCICIVVNIEGVI